MAVAYDSGATSGDLTGTTGSTSSFTIASTANRVLIVWVHCNNGDFVTSVKWNGTESLTQGVKLQNPGAEWLYLYYLVNPTATTSTVDVVYSSAAGHGVLLAVAYNGATTPIQFSSSAYSAASITETLTVASGSFIVGGSGAQRLVSAGTGATLRQQNSAVNNSAVGDSGSPLSAGSNSIQWTHASVAQVGLWCELPVAASAAVTSFIPRLLTLNVG